MVVKMPAGASGRGRLIRRAAFALHLPESLCAFKERGIDLKQTKEAGAFAALLHRSPGQPYSQADSGNHER